MSNMVQNDRFNIEFTSEKTSSTITDINSCLYSEGLNDFIQGVTLFGFDLDLELISASRAESDLPTKAEVYLLFKFKV